MPHGLISLEQILTTHGVEATAIGQASDALFDPNPHSMLPTKVREVLGIVSAEYREYLGSENTASGEDTFTYHETEVLHAIFTPFSKELPKDTLLQAINRKFDENDVRLKSDAPLLVQSFHTGMHKLVERIAGMSAQEAPVEAQKRKPRNNRTRSSYAVNSHGTPEEIRRQRQEILATRIFGEHAGADIRDLSPRGMEHLSNLVGQIFAEIAVPPRARAGQARRALQLESVLRTGTFDVPGDNPVAIETGVRRAAGYMKKMVGTEALDFAFTTALKDINEFDQLPAEQQPEALQEAANRSSQFILPLIVQVSKSPNKSLAAHTESIASV